MEGTVAGHGTTREIGEVLDGRYKIVGSLGHGGMGHVYRAEHVGLNRPCAVKLLRAEFRNVHAFRARFEREGLASGKLRHPNCVQVTDCGVLDDGTTFLVMELLEGRSLVALLDDEDRVPWPRALRIARHVLRGLAHAHEAGVVHRDIKPENVFLVRHGDDHEFAKVLDFGIAKLVGDAASEEREKLTEAGIAIGSPRYMSPEQAVGGAVDARSDLYTVSILVFELITGRQPFDADHPFEIIKKHLNEPPPAFADVAPGLVVPPAVEAIVRRGLAKAPDDRFPSAAAYIAEIDRVLEAPAPIAVEPTVRAMPHTPTPTPMPPPRPPRRALWIGAAALAVVVLAFAMRGGGTDDGEIVMDPIVLERGIPDDAVRELPELAEIQDLMRAGKTSAAHTRLKKLRAAHRDNPHVAYLLGSVYMDKRWWEDGFDAYRAAIAGHDAYRRDPVLIRNAIRCFSSPSQGWRGEQFLEREVGAAAVPFLDDAAATSTNRRIRDRATRLAAKLRDS